MGINLNNYEAYFLDYQEGNLDTEKVAELMVFVEAHPELKAEFESFELVSLMPEQLSFDNKSSLKKKVFVPTPNINDHNYEEWLVANLEGDLSDSDKNELNDFIGKNPTVRLEQNIFKSTILKPGIVEFSNKEELKKTGIFLLYRTPVFYAASIAASIILLYGLFFSNGFVLNNKYASVEEIIKVQPIRFDEFSVAEAGVNEMKSTKKANTDINFAEVIDESPIIRSHNISKLTSIRIQPLYVDDANVVYYVDNKYEHSVIFADAQFHDQFDQNQKSFVGRFLASVTSKLIPNSNIGNKSFLEYTVEGYNLMADREVEVQKQYDNNGNLTAVNVDGEIINLSRKVRNSE